MTPARDLPLRDFLGQAAVTGINATGRPKAITACEVFKSPNQVGVAAEVFVIPCNDPKVAPRSDRPCAIPVHVSVIRIHSAIPFCWRDECARRGCAPVAHPARLIVRAACGDSQCVSSGGSPTSRAGSSNSRICWGFFPLNITGQWARKGEKQERAACQARQGMISSHLTSAITGALTGARGRAGQRPGICHRQPFPRAAIRGKAHEPRSYTLAGGFIARNHDARRVSGTVSPV